MISDNSHLIVVNKTEGFRDCFTISLFPARELMAHLHRKRIGAVRETAEKSSAFSTRCIVSLARLLFSLKRPLCIYTAERSVNIERRERHESVFFYHSIDKPQSIDTSAYFLVHSRVYSKFNISKYRVMGLKMRNDEGGEGNKRRTGESEGRMRRNGEGQMVE